MSESERTSGADSSQPSQGEESTQVVSSDSLLPLAREALYPGVPAVGRTLVGRYTVLEVLGEGGMGVVLAAYDSRLDRRVALKLLHGHVSTAGSESSSPQARMVREAQAMARLSHPHVVAVYDAGALEDGGIFIAMEMVEGQTLKRWCEAQPRTWREVLGLYVEAGRGLAAAHAAGLVHRDFKPDNVLVGRDGRVRVTDFGVARVDTSLDSSSSQATPAAPQPSIAWEESLTQPGMVVGTPKYLAPELLRRQPADARSDLFSFCVALYEALYGQLPFPGTSLGERLRARREGRLLPPPANSPVPRWVQRAVLQGLSAEPAQRPASMEALLHALQDDPEVRRRARLRTAAMAAMALGLAGAGLLLGWQYQQRQARACAGMEARLAGVWDEQVKGRVRKAFLETGLSFAESTHARVAEVLDGYAGQWVRRRTEVCELGRAGGEQLEHLEVLGTQCLERRRGQLLALTELLAQGLDAQLLPKTTQVALSLPPLESCSDLQALTALVPPPEDPAVRARVEALEARVDRLEALQVAGKYREGLAQEGELVREVEQVAYAPLAARALYWGAMLREGAGDYAGAEAMTRRALPLASRARDDALVVRTWSLLLLVVGERLRRHEESLFLIPALDAALERTDDALARASALNNVGNALKSAGRNAEAQARLELALAVREAALGPEHFLVGAGLNNLANAYTSQGEYEQATRRYSRALAIWEKTLGPEHPFITYALNNMSVALWEMGRLQQAREACERALALRQRVLGPEHPHVATSLGMLGGILADLGEHEEALRQYERALALKQKAFGPEHADVAGTLNNLANVVLDMGRDEQARALHERALDMRRKLLPAGHPDLAYSLDSMGTVMARLGRHAQARAFYEEALAVRQKALGPDHPAVARVLAHLGRTLLRMKALEAAGTHLERARLLQEKKLAPGHRDLAVTLLGQGELLLARGQGAQARVLLERAVGLARGVELAEARLALARTRTDSGPARASALP